jgi:hypothetical protein
VERRGRPPGRDGYRLLPQSLPTTRTELTRRCCAFAIEADPLVVPPEPVAEPAVEPLVVPPAVEPVDPDDIELLASVPVTSTRLPTSFVRSAESPSSVYVVPMVLLLPARDAAEPLPVVPEVLPAVEPVVDPVADDEPEPMLAFVKMNDAPAPDPEPVLDAVEPVVADPLVAPVVPVVPPMSPRCRQPVTVIVPLCELDRDV